MLGTRRLLWMHVYTASCSNRLLRHHDTQFRFGHSKQSVDIIINELDSVAVHIEFRAIPSRHWHLDPSKHGVIGIHGCPFFQPSKGNVPWMGAGSPDRTKWAFVLARFLPAGVATADEKWAPRNERWHFTVVASEQIRWMKNCLKITEERVRSRGGAIDEMARWNWTWRTQMLRTF